MQVGLELLGAGGARTVYSFADAFATGCPGAAFDCRPSQWHRSPRLQHEAVFIAHLHGSRCELLSGGHIAEHLVNGRCKEQRDRIAERMADLLRERDGSRAVAPRPSFLAT